MFGGWCENKCDGTKPDIDPTKDPNYTSLRDLYGCIEDKCVIQLGACQDDEVCEKCCESEIVPSFIIDCSSVGGTESYATLTSIYGVVLLSVC